MGTHLISAVTKPIPGRLDIEHGGQVKDVIVQHFSDQPHLK